MNLSSFLHCFIFFPLLRLKILHALKTSSLSFFIFLSFSTRIHPFSRIYFFNVFIFEAVPQLFFILKHTNEISDTEITHIQIFQKYSFNENLSKASVQKPIFESKFFGSTFSKIIVRKEIFERHIFIGKFSKEIFRKHIFRSKYSKKYFSEAHFQKSVFKNKFLEKISNSKFSTGNFQWHILENFGNYSEVNFRQRILQKQIFKGELPKKIFRKRFFKNIFSEPNSRKQIIKSDFFGSKFTYRKLISKSEFIESEFFGSKKFKSDF